MEKEEVFSVEGNEAAAVFGQFDCNVKKIEKEFNVSIVNRGDYIKISGERSKEAAKTTVYGGVLPNTGEKEGIMSTLGLVVIAAGITTLSLSFKKYNEGEEE